MLTFRTFDEAAAYFDKLPAAIEATRFTMRSSALYMGHLIAKAIGGTDEDLGECHIAYHIEESNNDGIAGLFFDATTQRWTACAEL